MTRIILIFLLLFVVSAQNLSDYLSYIPNLSSLSTYINSSPQLSQRIASADNFTFLAPTNNALSNFLSLNLSREYLDATLTYHFLQGTHTSASLRNRPRLLITSLTNSSATIVTDGQRVKAFNEGHIIFESWLKNTSNVITSDLIVQGGLVHIVDAVLLVPSDVFDTLPRLKLSDSLEFLSKGNYFSRGNLPFMTSIGLTPNLTIFMPNSSLAVANFNTTGRNQTDLNKQILYHCVDRLLYGTDFVNGTELMTLAGVPLFVTVQEDGSIYVNAAKVTATDYLLFNGVMHVVDDVINPTNITHPTISRIVSTTPSPTSTPDSTSATNPAASTASSGLSIGAKAGIGVGIGLVVLALLISFILFYRRRRTSRTSENAVKDKQKEISSDPMNEIHQLGAKESPGELGSDAMQGLHQLETKESPVELPSGPVPPVEMYVASLVRNGEEGGGRET